MIAPMDKAVFLYSQYLLRKIILFNFLFPSDLGLLTIPSFISLISWKISFSLKDAIQVFFLKIPLSSGVPKDKFYFISQTNSLLRIFINPLRKRFSTWTDGEQPNILIESKLGFFIYIASKGFS